MRWFRQNPSLGPLGPKGTLLLVGVLAVPAAVLLFSLIGAGTLFGTLGVILAAPLAVVTMVLIKRLYVIETLHTATPIPGESKD